mmetsp:Transcript_16975/g.52243  ORF Transcript_16975/g.52243 Transcript_16975/m.52243 type:complete len:264 (+) Transcript_16975:275-1066(+)
MRRGAVAVAFVAVAYALAPAPPLLSPCAWQADHCARTYGFVRDHYETDRYAPDLGNWGVPYRAYADGYVAAVAGELELRDGASVFESGVGGGWFLRALAEALPQTLRVAGNDVSEVALSEARRAVPTGTFCVGDSLNLTWVQEASFDAVLCAYLEVGRAASPAAEADVSGRWVREMARLARPGGRVFVGANRPPADWDGTAASDIAPFGVPVTWWRDCAASDAYGWDVDPASVRVEPLADEGLARSWGSRYHVYMRRRERGAG